MIESVNNREIIKRIIFRSIGIAAVILLAFLLYMSTVGLPAWLAQKVIVVINSGNFSMDAGSMKIAPLHLELIVQNVQVYRKGVVGPAAVEAKSVLVAVRPVDLVKKRFFISRIKLADGVIRPSLCTSSFSCEKDDSSAQKAEMVIELQHCMIQGVRVDVLSSDMQIDGPVFRFDNIGGTLSNAGMRGDLGGQLVYNSKSKALDGRLVTQFDPRILLPVIRAWDMPGTAELVSRFDFSRQAPHCEVEFRKLFHGYGDFILDGRFSFGNSSYRGVDILKAEGKAQVDLCGTNTAVVKVEVSNLVRPEGAARVNLTADLNRQVVTFDGMSEVGPPALLQMIGIFTNECRQYFRFDGPVRIAAGGVADYGGITNTNFRAIIETEKMSVGPFLTDKCSFGMRMTGFTNTISDVVGKLYGGGVSGSAVFVVQALNESNISYSVDARIADADLKRLIASVQGDKVNDYRGRFSGFVGVRGLFGEGNAKTAVGTGEISIKDGKIFTMPVFGGFTAFMAKHVPGVDFVLAQTDAKVEFGIRDGMASSGEILVEGDILSLHGSGDYHFNRDLDFKVKVKLLKRKTLIGKVVQFVTEPISELFEFSLKGTLVKPEWSSLRL